MGFRSSLSKHVYKVQLNIHPPPPRHCKFKYVTGVTPTCLPQYTLIKPSSENDVILIIAVLVQVILIIEDLVQVEMMVFKILSPFIKFLNIKKYIHKKMA